METNVKTAPAVEIEPTSPKLSEIQKAMDDNMATDTSKMDRKAKLAHNLALYQLQQDEKIELANIKKAANELKAQEARNAKVAMIDNLLAAHDANKAAVNDKKMSIEDKNAHNDTFHKLREEVVNAVLGSKPIAPKGEGGATTGTGTKGETSQKIRARYIQLKSEGKTNTEAEKTIVSEGFSRGTTGAVCLAYRREIGEVA